MRSFGHMQIHSFPGFLTSTIDDIQSMGVSKFLRILAFSIQRIFCLSSSFVFMGNFLSVCSMVVSTSKCSFPCRRPKPSNTSQ